MKTIDRTNYQCACGTLHAFSAWVFAHWDILITHRCPDCHRTNELRKGKLIRAGRPASEHRWKVLVQCLAGLVLTLSLTACSTHFTKPGGTTADFEQDKAQCDYQVSAVSIPSMSLVTHYDLMHKCLRARGWQPD